MKLVWRNGELIDADSPIVATTYSDNTASAQYDRCPYCNHPLSVAVDCLVCCKYAEALSELMRWNPSMGLPKAVIT